MGKPDAEAQSPCLVAGHWNGFIRRCRLSRSGLGLRAAVRLEPPGRQTGSYRANRILFGAAAHCLFANEVKVPSRLVKAPVNQDRLQVPSDGGATSNIGQYFESKISHSLVAYLSYSNDTRVLIMPRQTSIPFSRRVYCLTPFGAAPRATATVDHMQRTFDGSIHCLACWPGDWSN
jgi:hypothetical protein